ncbi:DUF4340 domain-containing protein [uncultured Ruminococcus sp.]|uniref:DUF4340 domain-containing protein n=1 Tax=uncultured Ruminococcus sp. TaxID=165186 RepID=UPI00260DE284|nr:DUF4340 domain-containing protein [uncultured Ruminococcus sp.]
MKKQAKGIIALSALLAAMLGGGYAYMKFAPEKDDGSSSMVLLATQAAGQGTVLVSDNGAEGVVKEAVVKNEKDEIKVVMKDGPDENGTGATYTLKDYTDLNVNTSVVGTLVNNGNGMQAQALIAEDCTDLGKYGLADPQAEVEFTYESGTKVKFYIGDKVPSSDTVYVRVEGSNDVYSVNSSTVANYSKTNKELIERTILKKPSDDEYPIIKSLRIERRDMDEDMLIEYDEAGQDAHSGGTSASHIMVEPVESYLAVEKSTDITNGMFGLTSSGIYVLHCKEADIAEAGLSDPFCKVTMECDDGNTYVLLLSEIFTDESGSKCSYGMMEGGNVIYTLSVDDAKWLTVQPIDICSRLLITNYVWNITDLSVSGGGGSYDFNIALKEGDKMPESPKADDFVVRRNGDVFDTERYRTFYSFLASTNAEEFAIGVPVPQGEPAASIKIADSYSGKTTTYDFYDDTVLRSLIVVNGESKYYCTKSYVKTLIDNIKRIDTGEDYIRTW